MTVFRSRWDDRKPETHVFGTDTPDRSPPSEQETHDFGPDRTDTSPSVSFVSAATGYIRLEIALCQQCGDAIADGEEFIHSVTGGVGGRIHERCYWDWYLVHCRGRTARQTGP